MRRLPVLLVLLGLIVECSIGGCSIGGQGAPIGAGVPTQVLVTLQLRSGLRPHLESGLM